MGRNRPKSRFSKLLERLHPKKPEPIIRPIVSIPQKMAQWPMKPKILQFNAGRIEISAPYQLVIALLLGLILLVLVFFRLGQIYERASTKSAAKMPKGGQKVTPAFSTGTPQVVTKPIEKTTPVAVPAVKAEAAESTGNNRIVVQIYQFRAHLEPVKQYFADNGIETEIRKIGEMYYLVTSNKYESPEKPGTEGYSTKQKIIELGAKYKAPQGYETFGAQPFHDAYGMRFDD